MNTFTYWDNSQKYHGEQIFECQAERLPDADKQFEEATGMNPARLVWVSCQVTVAK